MLICHEVNLSSMNEFSFDIAQTDGYFAAAFGPNWVAVALLWQRRTRRERERERERDRESKYCFFFGTNVMRPVAG